MKNRIYEAMVLTIMFLFACGLHTVSASEIVKSTVKIDGSIQNGPIISTNSSYARSIASLGDLDGDGVTDIAVGAAINNGVAYINFLLSKMHLLSMYRLYNKRTGAQLYAKGMADRDKILNKWHDFEFTDGVPAFYANLSSDGNTPMYRLYNTRTGAQLYTKGESDRDKILNKFKDFEFTDETPAFYAAMSPATELTPIFRLYNTRTGMHLYTKGISDREKILSKYPDFEFTDGSPAFYASLAL